MTHTVLHIGDVHLCSAHPRNGDRLASLDQIAAHAEQLDNLAAVVIPGDLFHGRSSVQDRNDLADRLVRFAQRAPVAVVPGNHDEPEGLTLFARLSAPWPIYVIDRPRVIHFQTPTDIEIACFCLPWPHKAGLVAAGVEHEQLGQDARALLEPVFMVAAQQLQEASSAGDLPLMIAHAAIGGAVASAGQPQVAVGIELDPGLLARLGPIYKAFAHVHKHQALHGAVYAGSIARLDYAENEPKGFVEVEFQRDGARWEHRWRFVPLQVPRQVHVEGRLTRDAFTITSVDGEAWIGPLAFGWAEADVRVRFTFKKSEISALDVAKIHAEFAGCRSLKLDGVPELEREIRAPEVVAAPTLTAKAVACCRTMGLPVTEGLQIKLAALQTADAETILRGVASGAAQAEPAELTEVA